MAGWGRKVVNFIGLTLNYLTKILPILAITTAFTRLLRVQGARYFQS